MSFKMDNSNEPNNSTTVVLCIFTWNHVYSYIYALKLLIWSGHDDSIDKILALKRNQKFLLVCSYECKNSLNFSCLLIIFHYLDNTNTPPATLSNSGCEALIQLFLHSPLAGSVLTRCSVRVSPSSCAALKLAGVNIWVHHVRPGPRYHQISHQPQNRECKGWPQFLSSFVITISRQQTNWARTDSRACLVI